jgi:hypothetical protein
MPRARSRIDAVKPSVSRILEWGGRICLRAAISAGYTRNGVKVNEPSLEDW